MRRVALGAALVAAVAVVIVVARDSGGSAHYRVAAVFDTAKGMVAGQQVKIAGAVVGRVDEVDLVPGPKARMVMNVDRRFAPFRADATCRILPEGVISENFVDCSPGSKSQPAISIVRGVPTVPLQNTAVPTSLQDAVNLFSLPVDQRLRVIVNELGIATAGRGDDLNALLRRTNPALTQSQRVLSIIAAQRNGIARAVGQTDRVLAALATRGRDVRTFVDRASTVVRTSASHRAALGESVRRLPALLAALRPSLRSLDQAMAKGTPLLEDLRASGPGLTELTHTAPTFARAAVPALRGLASAAAVGRPAVRSARGVVSQLKGASSAARPFAQSLRELLVNTRDKGGLESIMRFIYARATDAAAYDRISHVEAVAANVLPQCLGRSGAPGCDSRWLAPGQGTVPPDDPSCGPQPRAPWDPPTNCRHHSAGELTPARRGHTRAPGASRRRPLTASPSAPSAPIPPPRPAPAPPHTPRLPDLGVPPVPGVPDVPSPVDKVRPLLDFLLGS
jgi:virulence factor Mce-like protein